MGPILKNLFIIFVLFVVALLTSETTSIAKADTEELSPEMRVDNSDYSAEAYIASPGQEIIVDHSLDPINNITPLGINRSPAIVVDSEAQIENDLYDTNEEMGQYADQNYDQEYQMDTEIHATADEPDNSNESYPEDYNSTYEE